MSASPVVIPTRSSRSSSTAKSRIASAARTARSGSSSCAVGAPKSAITASPMNFSTVPPWRSSSAANALVVRPQECLDVLRVHRLRARREPDEVAEDDRDDLALAPLRAHPVAASARSRSPYSTKRVLRIPTRRTTSHRSAGRRPAPSRAPQLLPQAGLRRRVGLRAEDATRPRRADSRPRRTARAESPNLPSTTASIALATGDGGCCSRIRRAHAVSPSEYASSLNVHHFVNGVASTCGIASVKSARASSRRPSQRFAQAVRISVGAISEGSSGDSAVPAPAMSRALRARRHHRLSPP